MGKIDLLIDELTPCLFDIEKNTLVKTRVYQVKEKKGLASCNKKSGWYINWSTLFENYEIYAISVENSDVFEGLIALERNDVFQAEHIVWMVSAPHNNVQKKQEKKYSGVGGHLFAVAAMVSMENNYGGCLYGIAKGKTVLEHYINTFGARYMSTINKNGGFVILEENAQKILEVYDFEKH